MPNKDKRRTNSDGASVEVVVKRGVPMIELIRGSRFAPEILTRDQAAALLEESWGVKSATACEGDCWVCLLNELVEEGFR
jgi:hypothetical protein